MGHPTLSLVADLITQEEFNSNELDTLLNDLHETMKIEKGIGIAAPQINISKQVALIELPSDSERYGDLDATPLLIIINPTITILDTDLQGYWEGCLSVPGLKGYVERPKKIKVDYYDQHGSFHTITAEGFLATVFQHELDHLFGKIYTERMTNISKLMFIEEFKQFHDFDK
jgi:peptide deformylase